MFSSQGRWLREVAVRMVRAIEKDPDTLVISQSSSSFHEGVRLYGERPDKKFSLQDCISMNTMRSHGITEVLTSDHHYEQEGFNHPAEAAGRQPSLTQEPGATAQAELRRVLESKLPEVTRLARGTRWGLFRSSRGTGSGGAGRGGPADPRRGAGTTGAPVSDWHRRR